MVPVGDGRRKPAGGGGRQPADPAVRPHMVTGDKPDWRPLRAFDDGRQTFIEFPAQIATGVAPPLFVVGADGSAELVNYRMRGHFYVVDRLFDVAELRFGLKRQQVVRITRLRDGSAARRAS